MLGFVMNWCWKRNIARKVFNLSSTGNVISQCDFRGVSILPLTKISIWNPNTQIKNPSKNEFLWIVLSAKLVAFFWNFGLHMDRTLSVNFSMTGVIRSSMQWRPSNRKLSVCLTGNEINKACSNMYTYCWTREFVLFVIHLNSEQLFADYREKAFTYSGHF